MSTVDPIRNQNSITPRNPLSLQGPPQNQSSPSPPPERGGDNSAISSEAKKPEDGEKRNLLDALKYSYGGNDRIQTGEKQLAKLTTDQLKSVKEKREFDKALTKHEEDHHEVAADLARSGPLYETEIGEDGQEYRKSGKVMIDTGTTEDPEKTVKKMKQVRAAALAPDGNQLAPLSEQDKKIAAEATEKERKAQSVLDGSAPKSELTKEEGSKGPGTF